MDGMNPTPPAPPPTDADLNRMCAEEMGWKLHREWGDWGNYLFWHSSWRELDDSPSVDWRDKGCATLEGASKVLPACATDPSAALLLVDALRKEGHFFNIELRAAWICSFVRDELTEVFEARADTFSRAITLAFLKTKGRIQ